MTAVSTVSRDDLGALTELGEGGEGKVFACSDLPGDVYKEFHDRIAHEVHAGGLLDTIGLIHNMPPVDRAFVAERTTWPHTLVMHQGRLCGFLMRRLTSSNYCRYGLTTAPRTVECSWDLLTYRRRTQANHNLVSDAAALSSQTIVELLRDLCRLFEVLHRHHIVVGDVSGRNILWTSEGSPRICLIDCDGARHSGARAVTRPKQSPDWIDPTSSGGTNVNSDLYKLGLAVFRGYYSAGAALPNAYEVIDQDRSDWADVQSVLALAERSLGVDRPTSTEWRLLLEQILRGLKFKGREMIPLDKHQRPQLAQRTLPPQHRPTIDL